MKDNTFTFVQPNFYRTLLNSCPIGSFWDAHFQVAKSDVRGAGMGGEGAAANVPEGANLEQRRRFGLPSCPARLRSRSGPVERNPDLTPPTSSETLEIYGVASRRRKRRVIQGDFLGRFEWVMRLRVTD